MKMKNILFLLIVLIFVACNSSQNKMVKKGRKQNNTVKAPAWFKNPPTGKSNLFAVATARSTHADYAINKGLQNAYAEMSRIVQSHLNGMVLNLVEEYGNKYYNEIRSISQLISKNSIADITLLSFEKSHSWPQNKPLSNVIYSSSSSDVSDLIVNGNFVYKNMEHQTLDKQAIIEECSSISERILTEMTK